VNNEARLAISRLAMGEQLVGAETTDMFVQCLTAYANMPEDRADAEAAKATTKCQERMFGASVPGESKKPFIYRDGVAVIPVYGVLLNKFSACWGFVTGYNFIRAQMNAADADPDVNLIVFDVDSPGGDAAGCFELTAEIRELETPTMAMVDDLGASAAYGICAAPDRTVATPSASVGSIGVYRMMIDVRQMDANDGIKFDFIVSSGSDFKLAGSPHVELTDEMREWFQEAVDVRMQEFVDDVIASRGLTEEEIRDTKARVYRSQDALARGLIDSVSTPTDAVSAFLAELASDEPIDEDENAMAVLPKNETELNALIEQAKSEAVAAVPKVDAEKIAADAVTADRTRRQAIIGCDEAKDKGKLAATLAETPGMTVEMAKPILASAAAEVAAPQETKSKLEQVMDTTGGAGVSSDEAPGGEGDDDKAAAASNRILKFVPANRRTDAK